MMFFIIILLYFVEGGGYLSAGAKSGDILFNYGPGTQYPRVSVENKTRNFAWGKLDRDLNLCGNTVQQ